MPNLVPNLESLRITAEQAQRAAARRKAAADADIRLILDTATREGRKNLTVAEDTRVERQFATRDAAQADADGAADRLERIRAIEAEEREVAARTAQVRPGAEMPAGRAEDRFHTGSEPRTYARHSDPDGKQFARDVARQFLYGDPEAQGRLERHMKEARITDYPGLERAAGDTTTANWAGLTVPQYLTDMYAPAIAARRPFADICNQHQLPPPGMSINISQVTTPSAAGLQASELAAVAGVTIDDTLLTIPVQTVAGQQTLSRQAIDRGTGIEDVVMSDLMSRVATALDSTLIQQTVTGLSAVAVATAYTDATPTAAEMYPKFLAAQAGVEAALLGPAATHVIMHSRRWAWLSSQLGSVWPLINSQGIGVQAGGTSYPDSSYESGVRGVLPNGLRVIVDNNIATNLGGGTEDEAYVVYAGECHLWEDVPGGPIFIRAEQPKAAQLGVLLVAYTYFGYTFSRYANAMQKVNGTGFIAPVF